jgi:hypothetical protein
MKNAFDEFDDDKQPVNVTVDKPEAPLSAKDVAFMAMQNLVPSAVNYGKSIATPFLHPIDTVGGIRDIAFGGLEK